MPELLDERLPRVAVGGQRIGLAAGAVEREHELATRRSRSGCSADQRLELADELRVATEREVGLDPLLESRQSEALSRAISRLGPRLVGEVGERRPAPQGQRLAQRARRRGAVGSASLGDEPLEPIANRARRARLRSS